MRRTELLMGMPITIDVADGNASSKIGKAFSYFRRIDEKFSTYRKASEISRINRGELAPRQYSGEMKEVFALCETTKAETDGYFDIVDQNGLLDPSGLVKGWAILCAAELLAGAGLSNFYVNAGGDIEARGKNHEGKPWRIGIQNHFNPMEQVKTLFLSNAGVATSGSYIRGDHIYNPKNRSENVTGIVSLTVIGPNVYEADRFATAAFAMGKRGIQFIEERNGLEGYMIDSAGIATMTSGLARYAAKKNV